MSPPTTASKLNTGESFKDFYEKHIKSLLNEHTTPPHTIDNTRYEHHWLGRKESRHPKQFFRKQQPNKTKILNKIIAQKKPRKIHKNKHEKREPQKPTFHSTAKLLLFRSMTEKGKQIKVCSEIWNAYKYSKGNKDQTKNFYHTPKHWRFYQVKLTDSITS